MSRAEAEMLLKEYRSFLSGTLEEQLRGLVEQKARVIFYLILFIVSYYYY